MQNKNIQVSIITVNYKVEKELIACVSSVIKSKPEASYEIIVVNNDKDNTLKKSLNRSFPQVKYIKSPGNIGYGSGNNLGCKHASGKFLFFLNPDTIVKNEAVDALYNFTKNNPSAGMVAPLLFDPEGKVYPTQGSDAYTLISAIVVLSFINKLFGNNKISSKFFHKKWNKKNIEEFDVVPGTAFVIRKSIFEQAQMFDGKFFLYFEEYDLAKSVKRLGYKNYIIPQAKVSHIWEASTKNEKDINKIFSQSRNLFFKKHHGILFASIINIVANFGKYELILILILCVSAFLGSFKISTLMTFIGDQGWFYLSARDMLIDGNIPLVGIASSRPWLHQGPLWTYMLGVFLWIFNFNPVSGAFLAIILGILSVLGMYILGSTLFSKKIGLISSLLYATSPLIVFNMRFPYHTSPMPFFVIVFILSIHKIIQNKIIYIPIAIFLLGILYNFEIATIILGVVLVGTLVYKLLKKEINLNEILNKKILSLSFVALVVPLFPMILYDVKNGFPQTLKFGLWFFYRIASFFGLNPEHAFSLKKIIIMFQYLLDFFMKLIFAVSGLISFSIFIVLLGWVVYVLFKNKIKNIAYYLIFYLFFTTLLLIILNQTPSDAYLPILFPTAILLISVFFDYISNIKKMLIPTIIIIMIIVFGNIYFMVKNDFVFNKPHLFTLSHRIDASRRILNIAGNSDYNLKGIGPGSQHNSFTMNYEYLTWWLGHSTSKKNETFKIYISESENGIKIEKK